MSRWSRRSTFVVAASHSIGPCSGRYQLSRSAHIRGRRRLHSGSCGAFATRCASDPGEARQYQHGSGRHPCVPAAEMKDPACQWRYCAVTENEELKTRRVVRSLERRRPVVDDATELGTSVAAEARRHRANADPHPKIVDVNRVGSERGIASLAGAAMACASSTM